MTDGRYFDDDDNETVLIHAEDADIPCAQISKEDGLSGDVSSTGIKITSQHRRLPRRNSMNLCWHCLSFDCFKEEAMPYYGTGELCMNDQRHPLKILIVISLVLWSVLWQLPLEAQDQSETESIISVTTQDPFVPEDELELLLKPLTKEELEIEALAWLDLVKAKVRTISIAEIAVKQKNRELDVAEELSETLEKKADQIENAGRSSEAIQQKVEKQKEAKLDVLRDINELREQRTALIDRFNVVLDELQQKGGEIESYKLYIFAIRGITLDRTDAATFWSSILGWMFSEEGGLRLGKALLKFLLIVTIFWLIARVSGRILKRAVLSVFKDISSLLLDFLVRQMRYLVVAIGILVGLSALGISVAPLLAALGASSFVLAFALQETLNNFACGFMILLYRPFDVDHVIDVAGISGTVSSMSLVSTTIMTFDNKVMIVPNSSIWGSIITNSTASTQRRVDMVFGIAYTDDIAQAQKVLEHIVSEHSLTLDEPEPTIKLHELADSSVNFICRPWVETENYWTVYWDVTRMVKESFDEAGISIPFPQRDVHFYHENVQALPSHDTTSD
ncbi:MAG: mechanosensitive ion channel [bacterium]|nr:mechanosensitive ion channel [bacterium]